MSCYIVPDAHISAIVGWACRENLKAGWESTSYAYQPGMEQDAADILYAANVRSVNARYKEDTPETGCVYRIDVAQLTPIEIIKACTCLAYQCDEWEGFPGSTASKIIDDISKYAVRKLPGYADAKWTLE